MPFDGFSTLTQELMAAKRRIEGGWCQGVLQLGDSVCMIGALDPEMRDAAGLTLLRAIWALGYKMWMTDSACRSVADWQDAPERTKEQVLVAYDRAIEISLT